MRLGVITVILASAALVAPVGALVAAPAAVADGDPASDVLVDRSYFQPSDLSLPPRIEAQLQGVIAASGRAGFPIRVALIASANDLGTATALWSRPEYYANYLWTELSQQFGGQVLVVMPNGFGLYGRRSGAGAVRPAEIAVRAAAPGPGAALATAALSAVPLLARAAGHPIPDAELRAADSSEGPQDGADGTRLSPGAAAALVVGLLLIGLAWTLSLRARPLRLRRGLQP